LIGRASSRCTQKNGLEGDHLKAFAKRGPSDEGNLQALCKAHNLFRAEVEFGGEFIREKIGRPIEAASKRDVRLAIFFLASILFVVLVKSIWH